MPLIAKSFSNLITFTRASTATYFAANGVLTSAANDVPRFDYDPTTYLGRGILIEESRTNSIRNNTMQGAVAPSTFPTNWQSVIVAGLTSTVVGTGTLNGITYLDVRVNGTASVSTYYNLVPDILVAGSSGQTWSGSFWAALVGGSLSNTNANIEIRESDAAQGFLTNTLTLLPLTASLTRYSQARTLTNASTAFVSVRFVWQVTAGQPVDFTLRIGLPQLEQGAFATSVIPTTTTALTRSADVASVNPLSPWYNAVEGTLYVQAQDMSDAAHATSQPRAVSINNGSNSSIDISRVPASAQGRARIDDAGVNQFNSLTTAWPLATQAKVALAYKLNDAAACLGGGTVFTDNTVTIPIVSALTIGNYFTGGPNSWVGWIQRITYYPRRLSNADLQAITA
jgi:hypothetical protein